MSISTIIILCAIGVTAGILSGFVGVGGGLIIVPAGALAHSRFLHKQLVVEQVDFIAVKKSLGDDGQPGVQADFPEAGVRLPQPHVTVKQAFF